MKLRPLVLDAAARQRIAACVQYAETHRFDIHAVFRLKAHPEDCAGNIPGHVVELQFGYRCVFCIEQQRVGWLRHLSVSVPAAGKAPNEIVMMTLATEFGFRGDSLKNIGHIYLEDIGPNLKAVNFLQLLEPKNETGT